MMAAERNLVW